MTATVPKELNRTGLYSISQAAVLLQVTRHTVYSMIKDKRLKCQHRKVTKRKVIPGYEIENAITRVFC